MASFTVLFDACVLHSQPLTTLLLYAAKTDLFRARWTEAIHREWIASVRAARPEIPIDKLEHRRRLMDAAVPDCLVEGYEPLIDGLTLPDADDRHVLAAAIKCHAQVIVTFNRRDFPASAVAPFGIDLQHPDEFLRHVADLAPGPLCAAMRTHRTSCRRPLLNVSDYLDMLARQGLAETVAWMHGFLDVL